MNPEKEKEDVCIDEYKKSHQNSLKLHDQALSLFSGNGSTHISRILKPNRPYITHASGTKKWDIDKNEYIDYVMSHGALILGHGHPDVVQAVKDQVDRGVHYGENHELEIQWAQLIQEMMPSAERVEFFPCGNEANMMAIRLGRIFTQKSKILRLEHQFHGWGDELMPPTTPGIPQQQHVTIIPPGNIKKVEEELSKGEYAVLMTEAGGAFMGGKIPMEPEFVRELSVLTQKYGTIWILDEVVTCFRDAPGGWQSVVGVKPDLTILGKCLGGGLGAGAIIGRADIMAAFSPDSPVDRRIPHSGTWNANPLTASAAVAACKLYRDAEIQKKANQIAALLRKKGNRILVNKGISGAFYGRSIVHLYLGSRDFEPEDDSLPPTKDPGKLLNPKNTPTFQRLCIHLLQRGIANMNGWVFVLSAVHSEEDIHKTVEAFTSSIDAMSAEGWF
jgi:glutamate-1-semialdehyde 2,1-aminomutase